MTLYRIDIAIDRREAGQSWKGGEGRSPLPEPAARRGFKLLDSHVEGIVITCVILKRGYEFEECVNFFLLPNRQYVSTIYTTYLAYMQDFFSTEFPVPSKDQILATTPEQLFTAFAISVGTGDEEHSQEYLLAIGDCMGRKMEQPSDPVLQRACRDHYRNQSGVLLGAFMLPNGTVPFGFGTSAMCGNASDKNAADDTIVAQSAETGAVVAYDKVCTCMYGTCYLCYPTPLPDFRSLSRTVPCLTMLTCCA